LNFTDLEVEGAPTVRGCAFAAIRIDFDQSKLPIELCGPLRLYTNEETEPLHFESSDERMVVTFISTKSASGSPGFNATWVEVQKLL
jgi:hypothetical protein